MAIYDDLFPHPLSPFRLTEFDEYLKYFDKAKVFSTAVAFNLIGENKSFKQILKQYESKFSYRKGKTELFNESLSFSAKLVYSIFLNNIYQILPQLELYQIPFIFTLYPGGGFSLNDLSSDGKLKEVFQSKYFRKVIVTQKNTHKYLIDKNLCPEEKIVFIFGLVTPPLFFETNVGLIKKIYPKEKDYLDICFVAHKYMSQGKDKGFNLFIDTARYFIQRGLRINFHIVGPWGKDDFDNFNYRNSIRLYGNQPSSFFIDFYKGMDILLSPNRPYILSPGAFDGFPTGAAVEASLCGVALFVTDKLELNIHYNNGSEIVIVDDRVDDIIEKIYYYYLNPGLLYKISECGRLKSRELYNFKSQMESRIKILQREIDG